MAVDIGMFEGELRFIAFIDKMEERYEFVTPSIKEHTMENYEVMIDMILNVEKKVWIKKVYHTEMYIKKLDKNMK